MPAASSACSSNVNRAPITFGLIIANVMMFLIQQMYWEPALYNLALWPWNTPVFHVWQLVSYAFLHGSLTHLLFNMFALYMFGMEIEWLLGRQRYLVYYFACVLGAAALNLLVGVFTDAPLAPTVGASGGVFGLLLAFGMAFPHRRLVLLFPPIPMPAWLFVSLYGSVELVLGVTGTLQGVAHFAHLGGMVAGFALLMYWRRARAR